MAPYFQIFSAVVQKICIIFGANLASQLKEYDETAQSMYSVHSTVINISTKAFKMHILNTVLTLFWRANSVQI